MLPQKSSYLKKIDELHKQIEESALKLQQVREDTAKEIERREVIRESVSKLQNKITDLELACSQAKEKTQDWRKTRDKEVKEFEAKIEREKENLKLLKAEEKVVKQKIARYKRLDSDIKVHEEKLNGLKTDLNSMILEKNTLSKDIRDLDKEKQGLEREIEKARGKADKIIEGANEVARDAHAFYQEIGPYISAIAQWHAVHGGKMPELLHDWKPKLIVVSTEIHKKLKDKPV